MQRSVSLTDESGETMGLCDAMDAHTGKGKLHKAISVYVFNAAKDAILIQKRSATKMLWPDVWANTCCSHPFEHESMVEAGERRLQEEMGIRCKLTEGPSYVYRAEDPSGNGVEHEHVTMLIGTIDPSTPMKPNPEEVAEWKWMKLKTLKREMKSRRDLYAPWFHVGIQKLLV